MRALQLSIACLVLAATCLACKSKAPEAAEAPAQNETVSVPQPGVIPAPSNVAAAPADAQKSDSGLACIVLREGTGTERPVIYDTVKMHQVVWTTDGKMHMNSGDRGEAVEFKVTQSVLPGLREAIEQMVVGEYRRCWIPGTLAFGEAIEGAPEGPRPLGTLVYDLTLVDLVKETNLPEAPPDVAAVPPDAERSASGLAWRVLKEGTGEKRPEPNSVVALNYTGWTSEGKVFMSTATVGMPKSSSMTSMIPGWNEGIQLMTVGEKRRFWIPQELGYRGQPGRPTGTIVFDIELLAISP